MRILISITKELISALQPIHISKSPDEDHAEWHVIFDLAVLGWLPATTILSDNNGDSAAGVSYVLYLTYPGVPDIPLMYPLPLSRGTGMGWLMDTQGFTPVLPYEPLPMDENELITKVVPPEYHDFFDVFSHEEAKLMPPHHPCDHTINLENDQMPPHSHIYLLLGTELSTLHEFLDNMLGNGFIRASSSPSGAPILFTKKKDGTL